MKVQEVLIKNTANNISSKIVLKLKRIIERGRFPNRNFIIIKAKNSSGSILKDNHKNRKLWLENKGKIMFKF